MKSFRKWRRKLNWVYEDRVTLTGKLNKDIMRKEEAQQYPQA